MMNDCGIEGPGDLLGTVAISKCGRDSGKPCIIAGWDADGRALVADGRRRALARPKKKNMKHLKFTKYSPCGLGAVFSAGGQVTDRMIRDALAAYCAGAEEGRLNG